MSFTLHPRLMADTTVLGDLPLSQVLLVKEALGPWLILVPRYDALREIHHLSEQDQQQLMRESSSVAALLEQDYQAEKINIGALGNLVPQLHIHHIARLVMILHGLALSGETPKVFNVTKKCSTLSLKSYAKNSVTSQVLLRSIKP